MHHFGTLERPEARERKKRATPHSDSSSGHPQVAIPNSEENNMHRECYKWWHSLFFYFISLVVANASGPFIENDYLQTSFFPQVHEGDLRKSLVCMFDTF